ncbi:hypothetical protein [Rhodococcus sp. WAY2]|uniref:hypothetical protein n=1 Tax=Rhodococcus sp. WAY2 TaxID=2663121 RepID=UPI00132001BB|nr:hypothetical protein [Rhodococcus sp. WAY2]QHE73549.1 hypothetical protein GFS60_07209 [Rhodococcus sp. WAY2]
MSAVGKVEDILLSWQDHDAGRLVVLHRLRGHGFTEAMLRDDTPTYAVLRRIPSDQWPQVFDDWNRLASWRGAEPWWEVGIRATR